MCQKSGSFYETAHVEEWPERNHNLCDFDRNTWEFSMCNCRICWNGKWCTWAEGGEGGKGEYLFGPEVSKQLAQGFCVLIRAKPTPSSSSPFPLPPNPPPLLLLSVSSSFLNEIGLEVFGRFFLLPLSAGSLFESCYLWLLLLMHIHSFYLMWNSRRKKRRKRRKRKRRRRRRRWRVQILPSHIFDLGLFRYTRFLKTNAAPF